MLNHGPPYSNSSPSNVVDHGGMYSELTMTQFNFIANFASAFMANWM